MSTLFKVATNEIKVGRNKKQTIKEKVHYEGDDSAKADAALLKQKEKHQSPIFYEHPEKKLKYKYSKERHQQNYRVVTQKL